MWDNPLRESDTLSQNSNSKHVVAWSHTDDWTNLNRGLQDVLARSHLTPYSSSSSSSSSDEEPGFDSNWEHIAPAGGASHRAVGSGSADRTGGHPIEMRSHHASNPRNLDREATPPPAYSRGPDSGTSRARRHREGHETGRHQGRHNDEASRERHSNSGHQGRHNTEASREDHGNSQHHRDRNPGSFRQAHDNPRHQRGPTPVVPAVDSYVSDTSSDTSSDYEPQSGRNASDFRENHGNSQHRARRNVFEESDYSAGRSHTASESQSTDSFGTSSRSRDSSSTPEPIYVGNMSHSNRRQQQSNALPRRRRGH